MHTQGSSIYLSPTDNVSTIVNSSASGTTFVFGAGVYNDLSLTPKTGDSFIGQGDVIFDGAVPITDWTDSNGVWSASGFPLNGYSTGVAAPGRDGLAQIPEDLYVNGEAYLRVGRLSSLSAGDFYADDGTVYISDNPTGLRTTASSAFSAFAGQNVNNVTIVNITVEQYANSSQRGAIDAHGTSGWTLIDVNAVENHADGLQGGSNLTVIGGNYSHNGEAGIEVWGATNVTIDGVTANYNNYAGFGQGWDAGGIKILTSGNVMVTNSDVYYNNGDGLWFDTNNINITVTNNIIEYNQDLGIEYEASFSAKISNNLLAYNAQSGYIIGYWGADLLLQDSQNVSVTGNVIIADGGQGIGIMDDTRPAGPLGAYAAINDTVAHNEIFMLAAGLNGGASDGSSGSEIFNGSNVWEDNTYVARNAEDLLFTWRNIYFWAVGLLTTGRLMDQGSTFACQANVAGAAQSASAALTATADPTVSLDVAQTLLLETSGAALEVATGDNVALLDTAAHLEALTTAQILALRAAGVVSIITADVGVELKSTQAVALETVSLAISDPTVTDTAADIESLTAAQIAQLGKTGVTGIVSTSGSVVLTVAQALALEQVGFPIVTPAGASVTVLDSANNLKAMSAAKIAGLGTVGVTAISSADASVAFNAAQTSAIQGDGLAFSAPAGFLLTEAFVDQSESIFTYGAASALLTVKHINSNSAYDIHYYNAAGVFQGVSYASYDFAYTAAGVRTLATYYSAAGKAVASEAFTANSGYAISIGGALTLQKTVNANGTYDIHYYNAAGVFQGVSYASYDFAYTAAGVRSLATYYSAAGKAVASEAFTANGGYAIRIGGALTLQKTVNGNGA